jgi:hypothetical protein
MKTKILVAVVVYCMVCVVVFNGCCKKKCNDVTNPACDNYDACTKALKASFEIGEMAGGFQFESDTVAPFYPAYFKATCEADSFIWYIGSEVIRSKSFVRKAFPKFTKIPVTLVVKKTKRIEGCSNDKLEDTLIKTFYTMDYYSDLATSSDTSISKDEGYRPIEGKYFGYYKSNPNKKCILSYKNTYVVTQQDVIGCNDIWDNFPIIGLGYKNQKRQYPYIKRLTSTIATLQTTCFELNGQVFWFDTLLQNSNTQINCNDIVGVGWLESKNHDKITISLKYTYFENGNLPTITKIDTFFGNRIN